MTTFQSCFKARSLILFFLLVRMGINYGMFLLKVWILFKLLMEFLWFQVRFVIIVFWQQLRLNYQ